MRWRGLSIATNEYAAFFSEGSSGCSVPTAATLPEGVAAGAACVGHCG